MIVDFLWHFTAHILGRLSDWQENQDIPTESHIPAYCRSPDRKTIYLLLIFKANSHKFQAKNRALLTLA
jgi:hypothetical protein